MSAPKTAKASQLQPQFINAQQAAALYGVSAETLRNAVKAGKLRAKRTGPNGGGLHIFRPAWLEAWAESLEDA